MRHTIIPKRKDNGATFCLFYVIIVVLPFIYCRTEPQIFSCRFTTWDEVLGVDYTKTPQLLEKHAIAKASANHCTVDCWQVIHEIVELVIFFSPEKESSRRSREAGSQGGSISTLPP